MGADPTNVGSSAFIAIDLGATSGRIMVGRLRDAELETTEVARFANTPRRAPDGWSWDVDTLLEATFEGLAAAVRWCRRQDVEPLSIAVDTWGVDFAMIGPTGERIVDAAHHRSASAASKERVEAVVGARTLFERTGVQPQRINTLFQLAEVCRRETLPSGATALLMPGLWTWHLTGRRTAEHTIASTTQMLDPSALAWDRELLEAVGIDPGYLAPLVAPATRAGALTPTVAARIGAPGDLVVVHAPSHDTAAAAAAIPLRDDAAFISCGTWSLIGLETDEPVITDASFAAGFTNELGLGGRTLLLRNLTGLWLLEEAVRVWQRRQPSLELNGLLAAARDLGPTNSVVDVDHEMFLQPGDVLGRIAERCRVSGQEIPGTPAAITRCILQSLAVAYRISTRLIEETTGRTIEVLHLVGGGARNSLLCQLAADACERPVLAGPVEATSTGNLLSQALAMGEISSFDDLRDIARVTVAPVAYDPDERPEVRAFWQRAEMTVDALAERGIHG